MKVKTIWIGISVMSLAALISCATSKIDAVYVPKPYDLEAMYDENQPQPPIVTPPLANTPEMEGKAPSDAIILFDGKDMSQWVDNRGNPARWKVENGYMEVVKDAGDIRTKQEFGSCQLHVEWAAPAQITGKGQGRGNSGVFLMNRYEIQVLDSYNNTTYPAGSAASVYGQNPPLVNASRAPGEWQSYDIIFHRSVFKDGEVVKPAVVTVFHNGILVQDHFEILGSTVFKKVPTYEAHPDKLPIGLQDHGNLVRFRNIWARQLSPQ